MKRSGFLASLLALPLVGAIFKRDESPGRLEMPSADRVDTVRYGAQETYSALLANQMDAMAMTDNPVWYLPSSLADKFQDELVNNAPGAVIRMTPREFKQMRHAVVDAHRLGIDRVTIKR